MGVNGLLRKCTPDRQTNKQTDTQTDGQIDKTTSLGERFSPKSTILVAILNFRARARAYAANNHFGVVPKPQLLYTAMDIKGEVPVKAQILSCRFVSRSV